MQTVSLRIYHKDEDQRLIYGDFLTKLGKTGRHLNVPHCIKKSQYTGSSTYNTPFLLQIHKYVILQHNNITLKHTTWHFRWNVQNKTINYYTHIITLPTTLKQAVFLLDPVYNTRAHTQGGAKAGLQWYTLSNEKMRQS